MVTKLTVVLVALVAAVLVSLVLVQASRRSGPSDPRRLIAAVVLPVALVSLLIVLLATGPEIFR